MIDCAVYIDEAGDLGINRGTKWFVMSAVIVDKQDEHSIRGNLSAIRTKFNLKELHIRKLMDFNKRAYVVRELSFEQFTYINVLVDTTKLDRALLPSSDTLYNYVCRYLLERVSWFMRDTDRRGEIVLSARSTSKDNDLIAYIKNKLFQNTENAVFSAAFTKVSAKTSATWDLLQLADVCATTMFLTYEVNTWGFCVPCYSLALQNHLYKYNDNVIDYGIKFFSSEMKPNLEELHKRKICTKKERTPGATAT